MQMNDERKTPCYVTFTRDLEGYKWWKPLLTAVLTGILALVGQTVTVMIVNIFDPEVIKAMMNGGYDGFNSYTAPGVLVSLGVVAFMIPALFLANRITGERPFSTFVSSRGGWDMRRFLGFIVPGLVIVAIPLIIFTVLTSDRTGIRFTVMGFILCTVLGPIQCIAEELIFRGLIMQTVGGWTGKTVIAVIAQTLVFACMHPYNIIGVIEVSVMAVGLAFLAWLTDGIEASSAMHILNNMTIFYMVGFGLGTIQTDSTVADAIVSAVLMAAFILYVLFGKKYNVSLQRRYNAASAAHWREGGVHHG